MYAFLKNFIVVTRLLKDLYPSPCDIDIFFFMTKKSITSPSDLESLNGGHLKNHYVKNGIFCSPLRCRHRDTSVGTILGCLLGWHSTLELKNMYNIVLVKLTLQFKIPI